MLTFPNAKINLGLNVVEKLSNGYHNLETVFYPIPLNDVLEFIPSNGSTTLRTWGLNIDGNMETNLVVKAFRMLQKDFHLPELNIYLQKNIPMGAGLGGGSADAAFMLKMLNEHFELHLPDEKLEIYASTLGADCAFFIKNEPVFAEGIGNIFSDIKVSLAGKTLVLIKPDVHVSTAEAYKNIACQKWKMPLRKALQKPMAEWKDYVFNDFETNVFLQHPELANIKQMLYDNDAMYASMSGSGSTIFGIFDKSQTLPIFEKHQIFVLKLK